MEDHQIVELYWQRDQAAIRETETKYGRYLHQIAYQILSDGQDSQEVVNDTYLGAWNSMPTQRPSILSTYLGKLARRIAIDRYRKKTSAKRAASQYTMSLEELSECAAGGAMPETVADARELGNSISSWLWSQPEEQRYIFVWRYFYMDPILDIAKRRGYSESKVKSMLHRMRQSLRNYLEKEGYHV